MIHTCTCILYANFFFAGYYFCLFWTFDLHIVAQISEHTVYFFRMFGMCRTCSSKWSGTEHSARTNRTVCGVYHVLRWCRRNQDGGNDYLLYSFFYIEFFYTLLIFLKLRNTKEMCGFFRGGEGLCRLWIQSPIVFINQSFWCKFDSWENTGAS